MADTIRQALNELKIADLTTQETIIDTMTQYFDRYNDMEQVRSSIKVRYGYGIHQSEDKAGNILETYVKENFHIQVDGGLVDNISIGWGHKVSNARATMFTEKSQRFGLVHESDVGKKKAERTVDTKPAEDLLKKYRKGGTYLSNMTKGDKRSTQVGSAGMLVSFSRDTMSYQVLSPADVRAFFAETIEEEGVTRGTDKTDLEDASVVVVRLSQVDASTWNYLAIMGAQKDWPNGRYVNYQASNLSTKIPEFGKGDCIDYYIEEEDGTKVYCNPLTYWANKPENAELDLPEYPIAVLDGGMTDNGEALPYTTSLHEISLKFDEKASHLIATSNDAARGIQEFSRDEVGASKPLPRTRVGAVETQPGISIIDHELDSQASVDAWSIQEKEMVQAAGSYSVPAYHVIESDSKFQQAESGVALEIKTTPLKKDREGRIKKNRPSVEKIFAIEKALLGLFADDSEELTLLLECEQTWDAGEMKLPQNKTEVSERLNKMLETGVIDIIEYIREYYQCTTDQEAIDIYEKMAERKDKFPPLKDEPEPVKPPKGLMTRGGGRQQIQAVK